MTLLNYPCHMGSDSGVTCGTDSGMISHGSITKILLTLLNSDKITKILLTIKLLLRIISDSFHLVGFLFPVNFLNLNFVGTMHYVLCLAQTDSHDSTNIWITDDIS